MTGVTLLRELVFKMSNRYGLRGYFNRLDYGHHLEHRYSMNIYILHTYICVCVYAYDIHVYVHMHTLRKSKYFSICLCGTAYDVSTHHYSVYHHMIITILHD
jgi:hypothetical protein